jgi:5-methylcytosine-specific restriction endonuclease McrA
MSEDEIINELVYKHNWSPEQVRLGVRAKCKCEYCGKDMFENIDNHKLWQRDHIIPKSSNFDNCEDFDNLAIACTQCNKDFKRSWNPANEIGYGKTREEYISAIREHIRNVRQERELRMMEEKQLFQDLIAIQNS